MEEESDNQWKCLRHAAPSISENKKLISTTQKNNRHSRHYYLQKHVPETTLWFHNQILELSQRAQTTAADMML